MRKLTTEEWILKAKEIHKEEYDYSKVIYVKSRDKVLINCKLHGEFLQEANSHLQGQGCPKCRYLKSAKSKTLTQEKFIKRCIEVHGDNYDYSNTKYINSTEKINVICKAHGEFVISPYHHLEGSGCKKCKLKSQTKLYNLIKEDFKEEVSFEVKVPWLEKQRFDIYFPEYNIAIEYNGKQHYESMECFGGDYEFNKTQERDNRKRSKCLENNCLLFEIKYDYNENDYNIVMCEIKSIINKQKFVKNES